MGMSSSQARLLTLTGRMHDIEYKAARLEAQKLQMANESRRVYEDYLNAIDATALQGMVIGKDGSMSGKNLTLNLINSSNSEFEKSFYLQDIATGKLIISPSTKAKYKLDDSGVVGDEIAFMHNLGYDTEITRFNPVANGAASITYSGVPTVAGDAKVARQVPVTPPTAGYQEVAFPSIPADAISMADVQLTDDFDATKTYTISTAADLDKLRKMVNTNSKSTQGVNFALTNDIYLTGYAWDGIGSESNHFKGIFDGNGYTVYDIGKNATASYGLFNRVTGNQGTVSNVQSITPATYGIIKNVQISGANIKNTNGGSNGVGALVGFGYTCYVENVTTSGLIDTAHWGGGVIGQVYNSVVKNASSTASVTSGGTCNGGLIGHDTGGTIVNCVAAGSVKGSGYCGGLIGHEVSGGHGHIYSCSANNTSISRNDGGSSLIGAFIGVSEGYAEVTDSKYNSTCGVSATVGSGADHVTSLNSGEDSIVAAQMKNVYTTNITLPSKASMVSNIKVAINKAGLESPSDLLIDQWLTPLYRETALNDGSLVDNSLKLASINNYLVDYINNSSNAELIPALISDINSKSLASTAPYQNDYVITEEYEYSAYASAAATPATKNVTMTIGSVENIAADIYNAFRKAGHNDIKSTTDVLAIQNWLNNKVGATSEAQKLNLAEINNYVNAYFNGSVNDKTQVDAMYTAFKANTAYTYPTSSPAFDLATSTTITMTKQDQTSENGWDMTNSDIADALDFYQQVKNGYIVVTEEQASSNVWLTNVVNSGDVTIFEYNKQKHTSFETSVATNTSLQEVPDETLIRKAEAKYEADMKRIDLKDRKYDTDLAALDAERNAIKQEMETLKTVAKENVERTFKLFS